jgi:hypothetical protein
MTTITPQKDCTLCAGEGFIPVPGVPETVIECECLVRAEAIDYLTPLYVNASWDQDLNRPYLKGATSSITATPKRPSKGAKAESW